MGPTGGSDSGQSRECLRSTVYSGGEGKARTCLGGEVGSLLPFCSAASVLLSSLTMFSLAYYPAPSHPREVNVIFISVVLDTICLNYHFFFTKAGRTVSGTLSENSSPLTVPRIFRHSPTRLGLNRTLLLAPFSYPCSQPQPPPPQSRFLS